VNDAPLDIRIFISYRREESAGHAAHLASDLTNHFGSERVFRDIDALDPGIDYEVAIEKAVGSADVLIAVIGRQWLTVTDDDGNRRIDDPEDLLRMELEAALEKGKRVIPVLVDGAKMPAKKDLPKELAPLRRRNAFVLQDETWGPSLQNLIDAIEKIRGGQPPPKPTPPEPPDEPQPTPPKPSAEPPRSVRELIDATDLRYTPGPDDSVAIPFGGAQAGEQVVLAKTIGSGVALFGIDIPDPGRRGKEAALHNLLRASMRANFAKASLQQSNLVLSAEVPLASLDPRSTEGIIRSLVSLGDVAKRELSDDADWDRRTLECLATQARYIEVDLDQARQVIPKQLEEAGVPFEEVEGRLVAELKIEDAALKMGILFNDQALSFTLGLGDVSPHGNKGQYMNHMLQLNHAATVAKVGLDSDSDVILLYEVPGVYPTLVEDVKEQFPVLLVGVMAINVAA
jgi:hypothetical protein